MQSGFRKHWLPFHGRDHLLPKFGSWLNDQNKTPNRQRHPIAIVTGPCGSGKNCVLTRAVDMIKGCSNLSPHAKLLQSQVARPSHHIQLKLLYTPFKFHHEEIYGLPLSNNPSKFLKACMARRLAHTAFGSDDFYGKSSQTQHSFYYEKSITDPKQILNIIRDKMAIKHDIFYSAEDPLVIIITVEGIENLQPVCDHYPYL